MQHLQEAISVTLPGQPAQYKAVPPQRPRSDIEEMRRAKDTRKAAVLALIHPVDEIPHVALIERNTYPGVHSGQISFPGGKTEKSDADLIHTAQRETAEEVGVNASHYEIWGELTEVYIPPSRFLVKPYVGLASSELSFIPDAREVSRVIHAPLHRFLDDEALQPEEVDVGSFKLKVPSYRWEGHVIWGATAMMISELSTLIRSSIED